jgi:hypothetical protein
MAISEKNSSLAQLFHKNPLFEWHLDFRQNFTQDKKKEKKEKKKEAALHLRTTTDPC